MLQQQLFNFFVSDPITLLKINEDPKDVDYIYWYLLY